MNAVTFDTLQFVERLREVNIPDAQAKAIAIAVRDSHNAAELATKADLREYDLAIRSDFEKLDSKLEKLELRMTIKLSSILGTIILLSMGALTAIIKFI